MKFCITKEEKRVQTYRIIMGIGSYKFKVKGDIGAMIISDVRE